MGQSNYTASLQNRYNLKTAIENLRNQKKIHSLDRFCDDIEIFRTRNASVIRVSSSSCDPIKRQSLERFLSLSPKTGQAASGSGRGPFDDGQIALIYEYILSRYPEELIFQEIQHPNTSVFSEAARRKLGFVYADMPFSPSSLSHVRGDYALMRPSWHPGSAKPYIRASLTIGLEGTLSTLEERQSFPLKTGPDYKEHDRGVIFGWKSRLVGNSSDNAQGIFKIWAFNEFEPGWPDRAAPVESIRGSLMALTDRGFVSAWPFWAERCAASETRLGGADLSELSKRQREFFADCSYPSLADLSE